MRFVPDLARTGAAAEEEAAEEDDAASCCLRSRSGGGKKGDGGSGGGDFTRGRFAGAAAAIAFDKRFSALRGLVLEGTVGGGGGGATRRISSSEEESSSESGALAWLERRLPIAATP